MMKIKMNDNEYVIKALHFFEDGKVLITYVDHVNAKLETIVLGNFDFKHMAVII